MRPLFTCGACLVALAAVAAFTASADGYFEPIADRQVANLDNERFPRITLAAITPVRPKAAIGRKRSPALSSISAVAVKAPGPLRARDRLAFIKTPAPAASTPIAAVRPPYFLFALDACRVAVSAAAAAARTINRKAIDAERTAAAATTASGSTNDKQPL